MFRIGRLALGLTTALGIACAGNDDDALDNRSFVDSVGGLVDSVFVQSDNPLGGGGGVMSDREILGALTLANASTIELSQMAIDNDRDADVKSFAQILIREHRAMNERVHQLGGQLDLRTTVGARGEDLADATEDAADELRDETGDDFDREYLDAIVSSHEELLRTIDRAIQATTNTQLDEALGKARTNERQHLERARQIRDRLRER